MAGLILGNYGTRFAMAPSARHSLLNFWGFLTFLVNSFLFILVGMNVNLGSVADELGLVIFCVLGLWLARALTVVLIGKFVNYNKPKPELPRKWQFIMWWGGLRGAIPIALALSIPVTLDDGTLFPHRDLILAVTFGVVLITLLAQGLSLRPVLGKLGFQPVSKKQMDQEDKEIAALIRDTVDELAQLRHDGEITNKAYDWLTHKYSRSNSQLLTELGLLIQEHGIIPREEYNLAVLETLVDKKKLIQEAWESELISGAIGERLILEIDDQIATLAKDDDDLISQPSMPSEFFRSVASPNARPTQHNIERNCGMCLNVINPDEESTKCRCGTIFHNSCMDGVDRCPICIAVLETAQHELGDFR